MSKKGVKKSLQTFKEIGKATHEPKSEVDANQVRRLMAERDLLLSAIAPADYAKIEKQLAAIAESPDQPVKKKLTSQDFLPERKDCRCSCHAENGGGVSH